MVYSITVEPVYPPIDWVSFLSYLLCIISILLAYLMNRIGRLIFMKCKISVVTTVHHTEMIVSGNDHKFSGKDMSSE